MHQTLVHTGRAGTVRVKRPKGWEIQYGEDEGDEKFVGVDDDGNVEGWNVDGGVSGSGTVSKRRRG